MRICLQFSSSQSPVHRARLEYAFRLFCAIYGHHPLVSDEQISGVDVRIRYSSKGLSQPALRLSSAYRPRPTTEAAPSPKPFARDGDSTVLFYEPAPEAEPDWLGEIFEWVSCADEYSTRDRDSVGRIPFSSSYIGRHRLSPRRPYAAIAMRFLQSSVSRITSSCSTASQSPLADADHLIVNTHDVDFLPGSRLHSIRRLGKNALISLLVHKSPGFAARQAAYALAVALGGKDPLDQLKKLADRERACSVTASYYFLCRKNHRRDGNYEINHPSTLALMSALGRHMEVGVHGSYKSLEEPDGLAKEFNCLRQLGFEPIGGRQHWLRFTIPQLILSAEHAGARYDASLGWIDVPGYRAGACFAFPPYDFTQERAAPFLEIPLVAADQAIVCSSLCDDAQLEPIFEVFAASRKYGRGGVSVLWHPTAFGGGQFPVQVGDAYWSLLEESYKRQDKWLSAASFVDAVWQRYTDAGLLPKKGNSNERAYSERIAGGRLGAA